MGDFCEHVKCVLWPVCEMCLVHCGFVNIPCELCIVGLGIIPCGSVVNCVIFDLWHVNCACYMWVSCVSVFVICGVFFVICGVFFVICGVFFVICGTSLRRYIFCGMRTPPLSI